MADKIHSTKLQDKIERNVFLMLIATAMLLTVGGLVEIVPLFYLDETMEHNQHKEVLWQREEGQSLNDWNGGEGVRPYTPSRNSGT